VNVICPLIRTSATDAYFALQPGLEDAVLADLPLRKMGNPSDVGELAILPRAVTRRRDARRLVRPWFRLGETGR
jgi:hypothetical protein